MLCVNVVFKVQGNDKLFLHAYAENHYFCIGRPSIKFVFTSIHLQRSHKRHYFKFPIYKQFSLEMSIHGFDLKDLYL